MRRRIRVLAALWAVGSAALLLMPGADLPPSGLSDALETALELAVHFALFFGLALLAGRGYAGPGRDGSAASASGRRSRVLAVVLAYCVLLEIAQIAVPGRSFEFVDIVAGWSGAVLGIRRQVAWRR